MDLETIDAFGKNASIERANFENCSGITGRNAYRLAQGKSIESLSLQSIDMDVAGYASILTQKSNSLQALHISCGTLDCNPNTSELPCFLIEPARSALSKNSYVEKIQMFQVSNHGHGHLTNPAELTAALEENKRLHEELNKKSLLFKFSEWMAMAESHDSRGLDLNVIGQVLAFSGLRKT